MDRISPVPEARPTTVVRAKNHSMVATLSSRREIPLAQSFQSAADERKDPNTGDQQPLHAVFHCCCQEQATCHVHTCCEKRATGDATTIYRFDVMFTAGSELPAGVTEMSTSNQIATDWSDVDSRRSNSWRPSAAAETPRHRTQAWPSAPRARPGACLRRPSPCCSTRL